MLMNKYLKKGVVAILIFISIFLVLIVILFHVYEDTFNSWFIHKLVFSGHETVQDSRHRLLCETDYHVLLDACRETLKKVEKGGLTPGIYSSGENLLPESSLFPKFILDLKPVYIYIDENEKGRIMVALSGGLSHIGVAAYSMDFKPPWNEFKFGDKELIPGLWYYDDRYEDPNYYKEIDKIIQNNSSQQ